MQPTTGKADAPMGKYEGYLICTDFDGTFAERGEVSEGNARAVRRFQEEGGLFTIASGRSPDFLWEKKASFIPNAPVISINGTMINSHEDMRILWEQPLDEASADWLIRIARETQTEHVCIVGADRSTVRWARNPELASRPPWFTAQTGPLEDFVRSVPRPWYKFLFIQEPDKTARVMEAARAMTGGAYALDRSWPAGLELHAKGTGKGECLPQMRRLIGRDGLTIVGVGDNENDASLLRMADIGYAVANATPECLAAADRVTVSNVEDAIARIIDELG